MPSASPAKATEGFYIPSLDGLRALAFLFVFVGHAAFNQVVPAGFGVTIFFFLSGYLITTILRVEGRKTGTVSLTYFYLRRAFRILPPMYLTLCLAYLLGSLRLTHPHGNLFGFLSASFYFYNYVGLFHWNALLPGGLSVLWSLMVEEHFYLVFPLLFQRLVHKRVPERKQAMLFALLCSAALLWRCAIVFGLHISPEDKIWWTTNASDTRFDSILFGCLLAVRDNAWLGDSSAFLRRYKGVLASAGLLLLLGSFAVRDDAFRQTLRYTLQGMALYPIFFFCISSPHHWQVRWLEWTPLRWLGWTSYGMYLVHLLPLFVLGSLYPRHTVAIDLAAFAIAVLYAWAVRSWVERPFRRMRTRLEKRFVLTAATKQPSGQSGDPPGS